jgi:hypothetical protein
MIKKDISIVTSHPYVDITPAHMTSLGKAPGRPQRSGAPQKNNKRRFVQYNKAR